jgi:hypothetical protein
MVRRQHDELYATAEKEGARADQERINWLLRNAGKGRINVPTVLAATVPTGVENSYFS